MLFSGFKVGCNIPELYGTYEFSLVCYIKGEVCVEM